MRQVKYCNYKILEKAPEHVCKPRLVKKQTEKREGMFMDPIAAPEEHLTGQAVKLRIMATSDVHVHLLSYDYYSDRESTEGGLIRTAALIESARREAPNSLLLDNGDILQGTPMGDYEAEQFLRGKRAAHPVFKAMNLLRYDAGTLGNHEFNYGLDYLLQSLKEASFPVTNANILSASPDIGPVGEPLFPPYLLLDKQVTDLQGGRHPLKIGLIGFVPPQIVQWDKGHLEGKIKVLDMLEAARQRIPEMKQAGADVIIAMVHAGYDEVAEAPNLENAVLHFSRIPDVDAIVFGHAHKVFPGPVFAGKSGVDLERGTICGIPAVEPGYAGSYLGIIDLDLERKDGAWRVTGSQVECRRVQPGGDQTFPLAQEMTTALAADHEAVLEYIRRPVGESLGPINSFFALVMDNASLQIVNDAQIEYMKRQLAGTPYEGYPVLSATAPFKTGGRYGPGHFTHIPAGTLAIKHIADLYNYSNTLCAVRITGAELKEWLEWAAGLFRQIDPESDEEQPLIDLAFQSFNFDVIDGIEYEIDILQAAKYDADGKVINPQGGRIAGLTYLGRPVEPEQEFIVATNSYRAFSSQLANPGGDRVVLAAPDENRQVLTEYIRALKTVRPYADGNWKLSPLQGASKVTFLSSPYAVDFAAGLDRVSFVEQTSTGYSKFRLLK